MSIHIMSAVWQSGDYSGGKLLLLLALADFAADDGGAVFPSLATMALKTRLNERSVRRLLRELETDGAIERVREATRRRPTEYRIGGLYCPPTLIQGGQPQHLGGASEAPRGDICDNQGGHLRQSGGTPESPNSPVKNHQLEPPSESPEESSGAPAKADGPRKGWPGMDTKTGPTWHAYAAAYAERYGIDPVWNASVAGGIAQVVRRVGAKDAPAIAAFYVGHNSRWYVEKGHSVLCLLNDAEKVRTEWLTGKSVTGARARQIERTATNFDNARAADEILAQRAAGRRASK